MKYEVEFACFRKVLIEAKSEVEACDKASVMENEEIEQQATNGAEYMIWNDARPTI
jgi:hypothetical protein